MPTYKQSLSPMSVKIDFPRWKTEGYNSEIKDSKEFGS
jgi:hypothetical protein